jgi:hypothetical protein
MNFNNPNIGLRRRETVSSVPKGLDFVRRGIALAVSNGNVATASRYAANRWGKDSRAALITKTDVPGLSTDHGSAGAGFVSTEGNDSPFTGDAEETARAEFLDLVRQASLMGRLALRRVPFMVPFMVMDSGPVVAWRDEGSAYASGLPAIKITRQLPLERYDLGGLVVVTLELLRLNNVDVELWIRDQLVKALAEKLDRDFIDPTNTGTAGVTPAAVTSEQDQALDSPSEGIFEAHDKYTGDPMRSVIVMNPWRAARVYGAARPDIGMRGGTLNGVPVLTTTGCPEEIIVLLDPAAIAVASEGAEIRMSGNASLEMETAPANASAPTVASSEQTSMFQTGSVAVIGSVFASWRVLRPESVVYFNAPAVGL